MLKYLRGWVELEIRGAAPELCLNRFAAGDIPFWRSDRIDPFTLRLRIYEAHRQRAEREISRSLCVSTVVRRSGFRRSFRGLRNRPFLLVSLAISLTLACLAQNMVWFVRVEGNVRIPTERILRALAEEGVRFGAWGPALDSAYLKDRMLNRIPELRWLAVNRQGCIALVPLSERPETEPRREESGITEQDAGLQRTGREGAGRRRPGGGSAGQRADRMSHPHPGDPGRGGGFCRYKALHPADDP